MTKHQQAREVVKKLVKLHFKDDNNDPFEMTDGQSDIFLLIYTKKYPRNQIIASTQYGKSDVVSMALIMRTYVFSEKFAIISTSQDKAMIIMSRVIQHTFDHPLFYNQLELDKDMPLDRLKRERSKDHVTWKSGGGIQIFTANAKNRQQVKEALTGFGSANIVEDEASLVPDDVQSMVLRMLGGHQKNFLLKIGNPFYKNHFHRSWLSDKYHKVLIDYKQALSEGRYSEEFIAEMKQELFFDILYECKFPDNDESLTGGYRRLFSEELLEKAWISEEECVGEYSIEANPNRLGEDFAGAGNDRSAYVGRWPKVLKLMGTNTISDTMQQVVITQNFIDSGVKEESINIDYGGLGQGIGDRLRELDLEVNCINFGQGAPEPDNKNFKNMRAYMYYNLKKWLEEGGRIVKHDGFLELLSVNYKVDSEKRFQIQSKKELKEIMKKLNMKATSPDIADAAALCFAEVTIDFDEGDDYEII